MNVLIWHVHGAWTTNFVQGRHCYIVPVMPDRGPDGRGRPDNYPWPANAIERTPDELADTPIDVLIVQRPRDLALAERWLGGRRPGRDVPIVWLEHNAPQGPINEMCHPARDRRDVTIVHVTHTNALFWDTGSTRTTVIDHGVIDPGRRWTGEIAASAVVVNEPVRRARVTGTDLLPRFGAAGAVDVFGIGVAELADGFGRPSWLRAGGDLSQAAMHEAISKRRCYVHPFRWTSLGLSLIEAMLLGMPVVALATTDVPDAIGRRNAIVSNDIDHLVEGVRKLLVDKELGTSLGERARRRALDRFSLERFLDEWDRVLEGTCQ
jgi:hypothetical protein